MKIKILTSRRRGRSLASANSPWIMPQPKRRVNLRRIAPQFDPGKTIRVA